MKVKITSKNVINSIKATLLILLAVIVIVIYADALVKYMEYEIQWRFAALFVLAACCIALTVMEIVSAYIVRQFVAKMIFFGFESATLFVISILTGNSFLSTLYCIVLTECYMTVDKFSHRAILFGSSCAIFSVSFVVGWVIINRGASLANSIVEVISGVLFGLLVIGIDFIVVQFIMTFYRTNRELSAALKEADESRARLEEARDELARTAVYEERNRIAKDIHDNAGHSMTTVIMQTEAARLLIDNDPEEAKNRIISANIQARNALEQMRESVHLLAGRPETRSLREEIEVIISQTIDGTEVKARYDLDDVQTDEEHYRAVCNALKECLANGIRHGKATAFYIELKEVGGRVRLFVSDNGFGVSGKIVEGFGLGGMRRKIEALGGSCVFSSDEGEGFETRIELPLKKDKAVKSATEEK